MSHGCAVVDVATKVATKIVKSATVRELKNRTSAVLRSAAREDVLITSRGRPVACLVGVTENDLAVLPRLRHGARRMTEGQKKEMFLIAARIWKMKPEKGKKWISQIYHDRVLYGSRNP
jgi:prevent-host-death family protein